MESSPTPQLVQTGPEWYETGLAYRYQMPETPGPYPTAVLLHGRLGDEDVMWIFRKAIPRHWFVAAPRAPLAEARGGFSWHVQPPGEWPGLSAFDPAVESLTRFLRALPRLYNVDPDRLYLMGFSQGAAVACALALRRPELVRGVAGLVGFAPNVPTEEVAGRLAGLPVFMAIGREDETVPYEVARQAADLWRAAGADLELHEYPTGHKMTADGIADLRRWFAAR
jgi:phospholipase/carboxylesterase